MCIILTVYNIIIVVWTVTHTVWVMSAHAADMIHTVSNKMEYLYTGNMVCVKGHSAVVAI